MEDVSAEMQKAIFMCQPAHHGAPTRLEECEKLRFEGMGGCHTRLVLMGERWLPPLVSGSRQAESSVRTGVLCAPVYTGQRAC